MTELIQKRRCEIQKNETNPEALADLMLGNLAAKDLVDVSELLQETVVIEKEKVGSAIQSQMKNQAKLIAVLKDIHATNDLGHPALKGISLEINSGDKARSKS